VRDGNFKLQEEKGGEALSDSGITGQVVGRGIQWAKWTAIPYCWKLTGQWMNLDIIGGDQSANKNNRYQITWNTKAKGGLPWVRKGK